MIVQPVEQTTSVEITRRKFSVEDYLRMAEVGLLKDDDAVELIRGEIVEMSPLNVAHSSTVKRLIRLLATRISDRALLSVQDPIQLDEQSLPQADIALLRHREDFYGQHHPHPDDVLLLVEVSDTSVMFDRKIKSALCAAAGIADYWVVNLSARQIEVFREPMDNGYRTTTRYSPGEALSPLAFADVVLKVEDVLGTGA